MERITDEVMKPKKNVFGKVLIIIFILGLIISIIGIKNFLTIRNIVVVISSQNETQSKITKENVLKLCNLKVGDKLYKELRSKIERNLSGQLKITVTRKKSRIFS